MTGPTTKVCRRCRVAKALTEFHRNRSERDGYAHYCKPCKIAYNRENRSANYGRIKANAEMRRKYGIGIDYYEQMFADQDGQCAICGRPAGEERLAIDHDHQTGHVRGLLCPSCNNGLGRFADSPNRLRAAADYLERTGDATS